MAQYIDKDALVVELERRIKEIEEIGTYLSPKGTLTNFLCFINTLDVKEVDLEKDVRQIISLYYEGIKYYEDVIRKEREENGGSDLAIKIMDGVVDARELSIQYVIDKLKSQKGE